MGKHAARTAMASLELGRDGTGKGGPKKRPKPLGRTDDVLRIIQSAFAKKTEFEYYAEDNDGTILRKWRDHIANLAKWAKKNRDDLFDRTTVDEFKTYAKAIRGTMTDKYVDEMTEAEMLRLPEPVLDRYVVRLAREWSANGEAREHHARMRERELMEEADSDPVRFSIGDTHRLSSEFANLMLFSGWHMNKTANLPYKLLRTTTTLAHDTDEDENLQPFVELGVDAAAIASFTDDQIQAEMKRDGASSFGSVLDYARNWRSITKKRAEVWASYREHQRKRVPYRPTGKTEDVDEAALFFYRLARLTVPDETELGMATGLPLIQDVMNQMKYITHDDNTDLFFAIQEYLGSVGANEILDVVRSVYDGRGDGIHTQERIDQSNALLKAAYEAPRSRSALLVARFQRHFSGWQKELDEYSAAQAALAAAESRATLAANKGKTDAGAKEVYDSALDRVRKAERALLGNWKPSTSFLSTSYNLKFTFSKKANLYILYHLRADCPWLWMNNDTESEILLPPGVDMCAIRVATTTASLGDGRSVPSVYVLEVLVRPGKRIEPYDRAPKPVVRGGGLQRHGAFMGVLPVFPPWSPGHEPVSPPPYHSPSGPVDDGAGMDDQDSVGYAGHGNFEPTTLFDAIGVHTPPLPDDDQDDQDENAGLWSVPHPEDDYEPKTPTYDTA